MVWLARKAGKKVNLDKSGFFTVKTGVEHVFKYFAGYFSLFWLESAF